MQATAGKPDLISSQGISVSIPLDAANSGNLLHNFADRSLLLRSLCKVGISLESKPGNQLSTRDDLWYTEPSSNSFAKLDVPLDLGLCCRGTSGVA